MKQFAAHMGSKVIRLWLVLLLAVPLSSAAQDVYEDVVENESHLYFTQVDSAAWKPVTGRRIADTTLLRLQQDEAFWYANRSLPKKEEARPSWFQRMLQQPWFRTLMWLIICGGFGAVLVWFLATSNIRLFHKAPASIQTMQDNLTIENIFSIDYASEIQKANRQQNFRLAIRLHYLQLLSLLAARGLIKYQQDSTNSDYLFQLYGTSYHQPFFKLTRHFEYVWYGQFAVSAEGYAALQKDFASFKNELEA